MQSCVKSKIKYSMICGFGQKAVPPPHTSRTPSTERRVWLCVSSTAPGTEWLKKQTGTLYHNGSHISDKTQKYIALD